MASPLVVNVIELLRTPGSTKDLDLSVGSADLDFGDVRVVDEPVSVVLHLESLTNGIAVTGHVGATWAGECRRCLTPVRERVDVVVEELYQRTLEDPDAYPIANDQIDLVPMVRENVLVALPVGPLCRPDCPGMCPHCGADLAEGPCGCSVPTGDPRWSALDALRQRDDD